MTNTLRPTQRSSGFVLAAFLVTAVGFCLAANSSSAPKQRARTSTEMASDEFFTNAPIARLKIEIDRTNFSALHHNSRAYARATIKDGPTVYTNVAIHLKGGAGSSSELDAKPALTLNFDRFEDRQRFHGL